MLEKRQSATDRIKTAWTDGDITGLLHAGLDNFLEIISDRPIPYCRFLEYTGAYLDRFILDTCKQEHLNYIGGKLTLALNNKAVTEIQLCADFYFQDSSRQWILKKKNGQVSIAQFKDYNSAPDLMRLKEEKRLEYSIDPPSEKE